MEKRYNNGIELLRLVLIFMVCILHTLGHGGVLAASSSFTFKNRIFWAIEIFAYCAVDGFAIISGYMATNKQKKYKKIVDIWLQVFFYSFIVTIVLNLVGIGEKLESGEIIKCAFPIIFNKYWYMTAYFILFFSMPIIDKCIFSLNEKIAKLLFVLIILLSSMAVVLFYSVEYNFGYSALWIIMLYCIGILAKRIKLFTNIKSLLLIVIWMMCLFITWFLYIYFNNSILINYVSPTILLSGLIMVVLFSRLKIKGVLVSKLSPFVLGIYLFQLNPIIWNNVIRDSFTFVASKSVMVSIIYIFLISFTIFICGFIVELLRKLLSKLFKISLLSEKFVNLIDSMLEKIFV